MQNIATTQRIVRTGDNWINDDVIESVKYTRGYATVIGGRKYYNRAQEPFVTIIMDFELAAELYSRDLVAIQFGTHRIELGARI